MSLGAVIMLGQTKTSKEFSFYTQIVMKIKTEIKSYKTEEK